ncbi:MAG TPA: hypothetical protein VL401_02200 [Alphaproteobacteria bacterium]|jgi:hypothetical protein|nr:hypothetical protein [Alphaproteobacteria bacterium]
MSKLFFDHLLELDKLDRHIKQIATTQEEREELWLLVDEIIHHKVFDVILDRLPRHNHEEFLEMFHKAPHDEDYLFGYLKNKIGENIEEILKQEIGDFVYEVSKFKTTI